MGYEDSRLKTLFFILSFFFVLIQPVSAEKDDCQNVVTIFSISIEDYRRFQAQAYQFEDELRGIDVRVDRARAKLGISPGSPLSQSIRNVPPRLGLKDLKSLSAFREFVIRRKSWARSIAVIDEEAINRKKIDDLMQHQLGELLQRFDSDYVHLKLVEMNLNAMTDAGFTFLRDVRARDTRSQARAYSAFRKSVQDLTTNISKVPGFSTDRRTWKYLPAFENFRTRADTLISDKVVVAFEKIAGPAAAFSRAVEADLKLIQQELAERRNLLRAHVQSLRGSEH